MIDRTIKRSLGQMMKGVEVVAARHDGVVRAYTSHWVTQVSFEQPIVMASISPKHDTYPLIIASGEFSVSILAGDQVAAGQYFSYPGRKFHYLAGELLTDWPDDPQAPPIVPDSIAYLRCTVFERRSIGDHELVFAEVTDVLEGRLREPPLLYSSRLGWRIAGDKAREPGVSIRDQLLERLAGLGLDAPDDDPEE
jgi:flavin reductase (DIM6/NTAB) family NADH-FMN oxidoreductase RutF